MKELTIEQKAKAYDEALAKAAKIHRNYKGRVRAVDVVIEEVFPELKESDDERIRKALINGFNKLDKSAVWYNGITNGQILAWLEKQGEQKPAIEMKTPEESLGIDSDTYNKIVDECIYGEQKPADVEEISFFEDFRKTDSEVEPKFKVEKDKWYVCISQYCNCIEGRNYKASLDGRIIDDYGTEYDMHDDAYRWFRPWTIQDAKAGNVLSDGTTIFIFKDLLSDGSVMSYCDYDTDSGESDAFCPLSVNLMCSKITPATKKQRDILFEAMDDAGYTFDFEKKELKKIEQSPVDVRTTGYCHVKDVEQNPAWSEKDDEIIEEIINDIECARAINYHAPKEGYEFRENWLESIKERVQPKQEWSEEDERTYKSVLYAFEHNYPLNNEQQKFVKSFKDRYTWKPSKEQMHYLSWIANVKLGSGVVEQEVSKHLNELYDDLKKLREK